MRFNKHSRMILGWVAMLGLACSEKPEGSDAALYGVGNLVSANDLVFTLSTDRNELRVLNLNSSDRVRGPHFVPAVNPLEPLSIPVLDYPNLLAGDLRWEELLLDSGETIAQGKAVGGPFVYAASRGRKEISVVGGSLEWLKELKRFEAKAPITAMAAYRDGQKSTLFLATYDGEKGALWALELEDEQTVYDAERLLEHEIQGIDYLGQVITALSTLPGGKLAVAVRGAGSVELSALHLLDEGRTKLWSIPLPQAFRMLTTHAAAKRADGTLLGAGKWLYALLDEGNCKAEPCESGIAVVDAEVGGLVLDAGGFPLRIPSVGGMPVSLGFAPVTFKGTETLAGIYVTGSGLIGMFDAVTRVALETTWASSATFFIPDATTGEPVEASYVEGPKLNEDGTPDVKAEGINLNETLRIETNALLHGVILEDSALNGLRFEPVNSSHVRVGDVLEVFCDAHFLAELPVADASEDTALTLERALSSPCSGTLRFELRAGEAAPYVVTGNTTGYMGRAKPDEDFSYSKKNSSSPSESPEGILTIGFGSASSSEVGPGAYWEVVLTSGYSGPSRDIQSLSQCSTRIASGIWVDSVRKKVYISFSSSNALVEVDVDAWVGGSLGEGEVACYR